MQSSSEVQGAIQHLSVEALSESRIEGGFFSNLSTSSKRALK